MCWWLCMMCSCCQVVVFRLNFSSCSSVMRPHVWRRDDETAPTWTAPLKQPLAPDGHRGEATHVFLWILSQLLKLVTLCKAPDWKADEFTCSLLHAGCLASYYTRHTESDSQQRLLQLWIDCLFSCLFHPDGRSYKMSADAAFLNNEEQIWMCPSHLNMRDCGASYYSYCLFVCSPH